MIYLAGSCASEHRTFMTEIAKYLRDNGQEVYCPFELKIENAWDYSQEEWSQKVFEADKEAIDNCDVFLMITPGRISSAGTNWEQGYAFGIGKNVIVFQITESPTSLMTFCGCTRFVNTSKNKILMDIYNYVLNDGPATGKCTTTLT